MRRMKHALEAGGIARQPLLMPEVVDLDPAEVDALGLARRRAWPNWAWWSNPSGPMR